MVDKVCSRCIMDTTVPGIKFDSNGECTYCKINDMLEKRKPIYRERLDRLVAEIKKRGEGKKYDCIVGVSGGRDSTYALYMTKKLGLRPLAVHFDNGWNSEIAVSNIKKATDKLDVDLYTHVADWEEFKDLQKAFLRASVPDAEVPTDYVITSVLFSVAVKEGIKYAINGHSFRTEGTSPLGWTYMDGRYIKAIHRKFGEKKLKSFPILSMSKLLYYVFVKKIREVRLLEYMDYRQKEVGEILEKELGWVYYGGHHHESVYTNFFQSYLLPKKFNIDKRKTEYSALIRSGQMTRDEALGKIRENEYPYDENVVKYTISKLGLTREEFDKIFSAEVKSFRDYPSYYPLIKSLRLPIKMACRMGALPDILYLKYFG